MIWANGNDATFGAGTNGSYGVTVALSPTANSLIFGNSGYTLSAASAQTITQNSTTASISVANGKTATIGNNVLASTASANANSALTGGGTLVIENGGMLRNNGTTNSNVLRVMGTAGGGTGSTLEVKTGGTFINNAANTALFVNGTLNVTGGSINLGVIAAGGTLGIGQDAADSAGTLTLSAGTINAPSANNLVVGATGSAGTALPANTNFRGIGAGTLELEGDNSGAIGAGPISFQANSASTVQSNDATARVLANAVGMSSATATFGTATTGNLTFQGGLVTLASSVDLTVNNAQTTFTGSIVESGGARALTKSGNGTLLFSDAASYTGATTINAGTLQI